MHYLLLVSNELPIRCFLVTSSYNCLVDVGLIAHLCMQVDNKSTAQLLESIIFIIDSVLPLLRKPPQSLIAELEQDLKHMIVRHSFLTVVHACIRYE